jgi:hypothetical protein
MEKLHIVNKNPAGPGMDSENPRRRIPVDGIALLGFRFLSFESPKI